MNYFNHKYCQGFNLLELMVAITIAGILATVGIPELKYALTNSRIKSSASDAHVSFLLARSEAIKRSGDITVSTKSGGTSWTDGWEIKSGATTLREVDSLPDDISIACNGTCPTSLTFLKTGRVTPSTELRFYVSGETKIVPRCLTLSLSGKPRINVDNDNNYANGCS